MGQDKGMRVCNQKQFFEHIIDDCSLRYKHYVKKRADKLFENSAFTLLPKRFGIKKWRYIILKRWRTNATSLLNKHQAQSTNEAISSDQCLQTTSTRSNGFEQTKDGTYF